MSKLFGTDGIRDIAGKGLLTPENVVLVGRALGFVVRNEPELLGTRSGGDVVVARDTRESGETIAAGLADGLTRSGCGVVDAGVAPTPVVAYLTSSGPAAAGVVISASHNPAEYNGIKVFSSEGVKLSEEAERRIEELVASPDGLSDMAERGEVKHNPGLVMDYITHVTATVRGSFDLDGMKLVLDMANGATCSVAPQLMTMLGASVVPVNCEPDGCNINVDCGSLHPEILARAVAEHGAAAGFAFDGDGDRLIPVDETGRVLDGDFVMAICGRFLKEKGRLRGDVVVATVMSNIGLERSLAEAGIELVRTDVGDKYVFEEMVRRNASLGGEQSGHIIFMERTTTGDGLWSALGLLEVMRATGKSLGELAGCMKSYPQVLVNVKVSEKPEGILDMGAVGEVTKEIRNRLGDAGRVLVRYSGTEPLARVMLEGEDQSEIEEYADRLAETIHSEIGV